jgi:hypothetical protein
VVVSDAGFDDLKGQVDDAVEFLGSELEGVRAILGEPGVNGGILDFGVAQHDQPAYYRRFPARIVELAARAGLGIEVSLYAVSGVGGFGKPDAAAGKARSTMVLDRVPEELLVEDGGIRGLVVRRYGPFGGIDVAAVIAQGRSTTVVRREFKLGARGTIVPTAEERFSCRPCLLAKLDTQLARLGVAAAKPFAAENVLDGESLTCRYRAPSGELHLVTLFCWVYSSELAVRRLGDFLNKFASSPVPVLRRRAWLSRFW